MLLHKNKDAFNEVVVATAKHFGLQNFQVEKDYYVSLLLADISKQEVPIVFKGGTSLSKCYSIIERFSEDIDLALNFKGDNVTRGLRKKLKETIIESVNNVEFNIKNGNEIRSRRDYNKYEVSYDTSFTNDSTMVDHIIVETIVVYRPYPTEKKLVSNYIIKYLNEQNEHKIIKEYNLIPFEMEIQTIERTFIDKLFAVCDYHLAENYHRYSRHLYDIHKIWESNILKKDIVESIIEDVIHDRRANGENNHSVAEGTRINDLLQLIINNNVFEKDYNEVTKEFLYKDTEYVDIVESLQDIINNNIMPNLIK